MGFVWVNLGLFDFLCLVRSFGVCLTRFGVFFGSVWDFFGSVVWSVRDECCGVLMVCSWFARAHGVCVAYSWCTHCHSVCGVIVVCLRSWCVCVCVCVCVSV